MHLLEYSTYLQLTLNDKLKTLDYIDNLYNIQVNILNYNLLEVFIITNKNENFKGYLLRFETDFKIIDDVNHIVYYLKYKH